MAKISKEQRAEKMLNRWVEGGGDVIETENGQILPILPDRVADCMPIVAGIAKSFRKLSAGFKPGLDLKTLKVIQSDYFDECLQSISLEYWKAKRGQGLFSSLFQGIGKVQGQFRKAYGVNRNDIPDTFPIQTKKELDFSGFSPRQQQILAYLTAGYNQGEAAERLGLSDSTVSRELAAIA